MAVEALEAMDESAVAKESAEMLQAYLAERSGELATDSEGAADQAAPAAALVDPAIEGIGFSTSVLSK